MTMSDVAGWLDLSWDTIKTVVETRLEKDYRRIGYVEPAARFLPG